MADYILDDSKETLKYIDDLFCSIQDKYGYNNVDWVKRKAILSDQLVKVYNKNSRDPNRCSIKEMKRYYGQSVVSNLAYLRMKKDNSPKLKRYRLETQSDIIHVEIKNVSNIHYDPLFLSYEINQLIKAFKVFFDRKFKLMFFDNQSEINEFISFSLISLQ